MSSQGGGNSGEEFCGRTNMFTNRLMFAVWLLMQVNVRVLLGFNGRVWLLEDLVPKPLRLPSAASGCMIHVINIRCGCTVFIPFYIKM